MLLLFGDFMRSPPGDGGLRGCEGDGDGDGSRNELRLLLTLSLRLLPGRDGLLLALLPLFLLLGAFLEGGLGCRTDTDDDSMLSLDERD